jgi:hypothetical protein
VVADEAVVEHLAVAVALGEESEVVENEAEVLLRRKMEPKPNQRMARRVKSPLHQLQQRILECHLPPLAHQHLRVLGVPERMRQPL